MEMTSPEIIEMIFSKKFKQQFLKGIVLVNDTLLVKEDTFLIVFSPFTKKIARVDSSIIENRDFILELIDAGFFKNVPETTKFDNEWTDFKSLTLLLTRNCNLDCIYCYASAGEKGKDYSMTEKLAVGSVDWFIKQLKSDLIKLTFHGGGEPTLEINLIKKIVQHLNGIKGNKKVRYLITTNGTLPCADLDWMIENKFNISVSMDGPPDIQDRNRPFAETGEGSSKVVEKNVKHLIAEKYPFSIRLTYSPIDDIQYIIEYLGDLGVKKIHLEPLFPYGRQYKNVSFGKIDNEKEQVYSPKSGELLKSFFTAMNVARKHDIKIYNGHLINFTKGVGYFCGSASCRSMTVTHNGFLTSCLEVVDQNDSGKEIFFIGKFDQKAKNFEIDFEKIKFLQKRHADFLSKCKRCYARYHCAGGCAIKAVRSTGDFYKRDLSYCSFTKALVPKLVKQIAKISGV